MELRFSTWLCIICLIKFLVVVFFIKICFKLLIWNAENQQNTEGLSQYDTNDS